MLGKLIKHEVRATGRYMWIVYAAMLLLSIGGCVGFHINNTENGYLGVVSAMLIILWILALIVGAALSAVLLIHRFYKNLLTDEGYLMFTLPVSAHQLVLSKMLVAAVWHLMTIGVVVLCVCIGVFQNTFLQDLGAMLKNMTTQLALNGTVMLLELLVVAFLGCCAGALELYCAMSIGYGFVSHKGLWSVLSFFGIQTIFQFLGSFLLVGFQASDLVDLYNRWSLGTMGQWHMTMLAAGLAVLVSGVIFYIITVWNLKKRLNLA